MPSRITLTVPGLGGSGPDHWQSIWEWARHDCFRVAQDGWHDPSPADWTRRLDEAVAAAGSPVILVAHSLGCAAVAHWAARYPEATGAVVAALLVAPCDIERSDAPPAISRFAPLPPAALPFRSTVVASSDDRYATLARAQGFAELWGSAFVDAGPLGHINAASQLGAWRFGQVLLDELLDAAPAATRYRRAAALRDAPLPA